MLAVKHEWRRRQGSHSHVSRIQSPFLETTGFPFSSEQASALWGTAWLLSSLCEMARSA